jgi:hypothetical protein
MKIQYWKRSSAIIISSLFVIGFAEGKALASSVSASAQMSWASLQITGSGSAVIYNPPTTTWSSSWSRVGTSNQWEIPSYDIDNFQFGIVATSASFNEPAAISPSLASATAKTDLVPGQENLIATVSLEATNYEKYSAIATAQRDIFYHVTGSGTLTFSINYTLNDININASDGYAWADILAYTYLTRHNDSTGNWDPITGFVTREQQSESGSLTNPNLIVFDDYYYNDPLTHTLSFTYTATADEYLHFGAVVKAKATAQSAVPIPGAVWLLGSGLLGIIATRRKKLVQ